MLTLELGEDEAEGDAELETDAVLDGVDTGVGDGDLVDDTDLTELTVGVRLEDDDRECDPLELVLGVPVFDALEDELVLLLGDGDDEVEADGDGVAEGEAVVDLLGFTEREERGVDETVEEGEMLGFSVTVEVFEFEELQVVETVTLTEVDPVREGVGEGDFVLLVVRLTDVVAETVSVGVLDVEIDRVPVTDTDVDPDELEDGDDDALDDLDGDSVEDELEE